MVDFVAVVVVVVVRRIHSRAACKLTQVLASYRSRMENLREALEIAASHFVESTGMVDKVCRRRARARV